MDNIKGILIILVIVGHLLELDLKYGMNRFFYTFIYLFHMPVFVFVSGYFAKFDIKRIVLKLLYPYVLFQILYLIFGKYVLGLSTKIQFITPYWLLWYLFAMIVWTAVIPLLSGTPKKKLVIFLFSFVLALVIGYYDKIGRTGSLSRIVVFLPFFMAGYEAKEWYRIKEGFFVIFKWTQEHRRALLIASGLILAGILVIGIKLTHTDYNWLYEAVSYAKSRSTYRYRLLHMILASFCLFMILFLMPNKNLPILSRIGRNTMPVYLLHGFLIKLIDKFDMIKRWQHEMIAITILLVGIIVVLSSDPICKIMKWIFNVPSMVFRLFHRSVAVCKS